MRTHRHTNDTKTAIGYVRVSTQEQATDGVSLDAQRDKLRAYCRLHEIKLIDIKADEGISGSTLNRPGLQAARQMLRRGRANTLIVAKLDRLSRSLKDASSGTRAQAGSACPLRSPTGYTAVQFALHSVSFPSTTPTPTRPSFGPLDSGGRNRRRRRQGLGQHRRRDLGGRGRRIRSRSRSQRRRRRSPLGLEHAG